MITKEIFHESFTSLWQNKGRTFLSILGIVIGIASVITMVAIGNGSQSQITDSISSLGTNLLTVSPTGTGTLKQKDAELILANDFTGLIDDISPEVSSRLTLTVGDTSENVSVTGAEENYLDVHSKDLAYGYFFTASEVTQESHVIVIGSTTAETFFGNSRAALNQKIQVGSFNFTVIGVLESTGGDSNSNADNVAIIPLTVMQNQINNSRELSSLAITMQDANQLEAVKSLVGYTLLYAHGYDDVDDADFSLLSATDLLETLSTVTGTFTMLLAGIASISLLVGGIGIMNVMLMSVLERTREIGLRKALGAKKKYLVEQFLIEALLITLIGGIIGLALGFIASFTLSYFFEITATISASSVVLAITISVAIGLAFGIYPANKAAKMAPIEALRSD